MCVDMPEYFFFSQSELLTDLKAWVLKANIYVNIQKYEQSSL